METGKIEEKRLETDELVEDSQNSQKTRRKIYSSKTKMKNQKMMYGTAKTEKIRGIHV